MKYLRRLPLSAMLLTFYSLLFFAFIYAPLALIVTYSFNANPVNMMVWDGFTLDWYRIILGLKDRPVDIVNSSSAYLDSTDQLLEALRNSLIIATSTTTISTVIGTSAAIALARSLHVSDLLCLYHRAGADGGA